MLDAVRRGDFSRRLPVPATGDARAIYDALNEVIERNDMIRNLRETTQKNTEQDWLKTNLAKFSRLLQG